MAARTAFKAFLSHKYKAPSVNEFFFQLFSRIAQVQFEVDVGTNATNVTRLERLIRDTDAFIGIYPFDESENSNPPNTELLKNSRYFRLELEIAARAAKPGLIFKDTRFRDLFSAAPPISETGFDIQEVVSRGEKPSSAKFEMAFVSLCDRLEAARSYALTQEKLPQDSNIVGLLLPRPGANRGYGPDQLKFLSDTLRNARYRPVEFQWPPIITPDWIRQIRELNWIVVDVGPEAAATGVLGFLHGAFIPAMRLHEVSDPHHQDLSSGEALYSGVEVGYIKDIVRWWDFDSLSKGVEARMASLEVPRQRISTLPEALKYFQSAALRKEAVFASYAGADRDIARDLLTAIGNRFQEVFDYRDGQSIRAGKPWLNEIFERLSVSPIGVPLLSSAYVKSGNCMHELREIIARADNKEMRIFPIKLKADDSFLMPPELGAFQYIRLWEYPDPQKLVDWIVTNIST